MLPHVYEKNRKSATGATLRWLPQAREVSEIFVSVIKKHIYRQGKGGAGSSTAKK